MNGRIERVDARLEIVSEMNYQTINDELEADRKLRIRRRIEGWIALACFFAYLWFVIWGGARGL
jgi:hypothetical protein